MGADLLGSVAEGHPLGKGVLIDVNGAAGEQVLTAVEINRDGFAGQAIGFDGEIHFDLSAAKGEFRNSNIGDADVDKPLALSDPDREDWQRKGVRIFHGFDFPVGDPIREEKDCALITDLSGSFV